MKPQNRAFFKHFGSKGRISAKLPQPRFKTIIEPFAGSAAYSVRYATPDHRVILTDTDERVCMVWDFLIRASPADIMSLPVDHFLKGGDLRELNLDEPRRLFIQRWLSISGSHSNRLAPCLLGDRNGHAGNTWSHKARARVASQVDSIRSWSIRCVPYTAIDNLTAHWHIDPPYQSNAHGNAEYKHEPIDYGELATWCRERRGDVTVHEQLGANWLPFETLDPNARTSSIGRDKTLKKAHEVYWTNNGISK
jgi:site-specific DNA-adenine methylase